MGGLVRGRFAPTPSGRMHLGNLFAALLTWLDVRTQGGELLLRMEDLDRDRCHPAYATQLVDDLRWLGLDWDLGYEAGETHHLQSLRGEYYEAALRQLEEKGLLYPCYCSRRERMTAHAPHLSDGSVRYEGHCRHLTDAERIRFLAEGRQAAVRIRVPAERVGFVDENFGVYEENLQQDCGDFILRRSDGVFAYQLAVVVDDAWMGVNRVVRGSDLLGSTPRQIWLFRQLGYAVPCYAHAPLLIDAQGRRLSKRDHDLDMAFLRQSKTPEQLVGFLGYLAGLLDRAEPMSAQELLPLFSWKMVGCQDKVVNQFGD